MEDYEFTKVKIGDKFYFPIYRHRIVVPCTIIFIEDVYMVPGIEGSVWVYTDEKGSSVDLPTDKRDKNGWRIYEHKELTEIPDTWQHVNQFVMIDEPIGHGISVDTELCLTLDEALQEVKPRRKKHLLRAHRAYRKAAIDFIAMSRTKEDEARVRKELQAMYFPKRVYARKG